MEKIKVWAENLKRQIFILYFAYKDERVAWYAKLFTTCIVAYAFSPIDLIPDFIPILGYVDDVIIVPLGIMFALKMIPKNVLSDCTLKVEELLKKDKPKNWIVGSLIILIWSLFILWLIVKVYQFLN
ncbi:YkvA family protein [Caldalkalibacillus mannanilyticus]|uniref:YkvA family protein n=1 Tax=Caldalkalibacillus mannanilyticus TaxID=1418 RepID=UPI00046A68D5|nr:YkvA family protein [Caldalkalibacillus mannanilyticus]